MKKHILAFLGIILIPCIALSADPADPPAARQARERMVREQIQARGISRPEVLNAMASVPRHWFVPEDLADAAYKDHPLPIGEGQTISQPYIVALMTELLDTKPSGRVLEIGTGSGYQAAIVKVCPRHGGIGRIVPSIGKRLLPWHWLNRVQTSLCCVTPNR